MTYVFISTAFAPRDTVDRAKVLLPTGARAVLLNEHFGKPRPVPRPDEIPAADFSDSRERERIAKGLGDVGPIAGIVALDEYAIGIAAELRLRFGVPGLLPDDVARFRDKAFMKRIVAARGIRAPRTYTAGELCRREIRFPLVCKPRGLAGGTGVRIVRDEPALQALVSRHAASLDAAFRDMDESCVLFEEHVRGDLHHVDGVVVERAVACAIPSRYVNTPLEYRAGAALGSVMLGGARERAEWLGFSQRVVSALGVVNGVFHLEAFRNESGKLVFLEIGLRPGGGPIVPLIAKTHGIDLETAHVRAELGLPLGPYETSRRIGGYLIVPEAPLGVSSPVSFKETRETVLFEGPSEAHVEEEMRCLMQRYKMVV